MPTQLSLFDHVSALERQIAAYKAAVSLCCTLCQRIIDALDADAARVHLAALEEAIHERKAAEQALPGQTAPPPTLCPAPPFVQPLYRCAVCGAERPVPGTCVACTQQADRAAKLKESSTGPRPPAASGAAAPTSAIGGVVGTAQATASAPTLAPSPPSSIVVPPTTPTEREAGEGAPPFAAPFSAPVAAVSPAADRAAVVPPPARGATADAPLFLACGRPGGDGVTGPSPSVEASAESHPLAASGATDLPGTGASSAAAPAAPSGGGPTAGAPDFWLGEDLAGLGLDGATALASCALTALMGAKPGKSAVVKGILVDPVLHVFLTGTGQWHWRSGRLLPLVPVETWRALNPGREPAEAPTGTEYEGMLVRVKHKHRGGHVISGPECPVRWLDEKAQRPPEGWTREGAAEKEKLLAESLAECPSPHDGPPFATQKAEDDALKDVPVTTFPGGITPPFRQPERPSREGRPNNLPSTEAPPSPHDGRVGTAEPGQARYRLLLFRLNETSGLPLAQWWSDSPDVLRRQAADGKEVASSQGHYYHLLDSEMGQRMDLAASAPLYAGTQDGVIERENPGPPLDKSGWCRDCKGTGRSLAVIGERQTACSACGGSGLASEHPPQGEGSPAGLPPREGGDPPVAAEAAGNGLLFPSETPTAAEGKL